MFFDGCYFGMIGLGSLVFLEGEIVELWAGEFGDRGRGNWRRWQWNLEKGQWKLESFAFIYGAAWAVGFFWVNF